MGVFICSFIFALAPTISCRDPNICPIPQDEGKYESRGRIWMSRANMNENIKTYIELYIYAILHYIYDLSPTEI